MFKNLIRSICVGVMVALSLPISANASEISKGQYILDCAFNTLDSNIQHYYDSQDYNLIISNVDINQLNGFENVPHNVRGIIDYKDKVIAIRMFDGNPTVSQRVYLHEIGHMVDSINNYTGRYSSSEEFHNIWARDVKKMKAFSDEIYIEQRQDECFAECFCYYYWDKELLKATSNDAYNYIDKIVKGVM